MDDIMQPELLSGLCRDVATFPAAEFAMTKLGKWSIVRLDKSTNAIDGRHGKIETLSRAKNHNPFFELHRSVNIYVYMGYEITPLLQK